MATDPVVPTAFQTVDPYAKADRNLQLIMMIAENCREHLRDIRFRCRDEVARDQSSQCYRDSLQALREAVDELCPPF